MTLFEANQDLLDTTVDDTLGDTILYQRAGETGFTPLTGFIIIINGEEFGLGAIDELDERRRVKIRISKIDKPKPSDRIQSAKLGSGTFRPIGKFDTTGGRYWISDVQKV